MTKNLCQFYQVFLLANGIFSLEFTVCITSGFFVVQFFKSTKLLRKCFSEKTFQETKKKSFFLQLVFQRKNCRSRQEFTTEFDLEKFWNYLNPSSK
jgi:hypothetical protein